MFEKNKTQLTKSITPDMIASNSDYVWLIFFGQLPEYGKRLHSPFRNDRNPKCRWRYANNQWYFIDNKGYNNRIMWSIYDFVGWLNPHLDNKGIYSLICQKLLETVPNIVSIPDRRPNSSIVQNSNITIKFEYEEWDEDDYFTKEYDISPEYMNMQPYYKVTTYWCNSKKDNTIRRNPFYNPKNNITIAYHFRDSGHTKLYWPEKEKDKLKWYSNCNAEDIFGWHRIDSYTDEIAILKSAKDELIINYHYGINTLATQSEAIVQSLKLYNVCEVKEINSVKIWYDNDETGQQNSRRFTEWWGNYFRQSKKNESKDGFFRSISRVETNPGYGKDPAEIYKSHRGYLDKIINNEFKQ